MKTNIQTVLVPKSFGLKEANKWISENGYKTSFYGKPVDITENYYRYRQKKPSKTYTYRTRTLANGIQIVYYRKKKMM